MSLPAEYGEAARCITVMQGGIAISRQAEVVLTTVLGSCVAVCLHDRKAGIGGMNHIVLPERSRPGSDRWGMYLIELLINELLKAGARKERLAAKVFGGAHMSEKLPQIGHKNVDLARGYLRTEAIPVLATSTGGRLARRVRFWPHTGEARQLLVPGMAAPATTENLPPKAGLTLFGAVGA
ncbi:chemotaxis protein CheD [Oceanicola granulosus HTCC2516]|uniref:Probable chemoreceptor glutamine deamidase CheD n=1 Tax=Oceanicola granulosus (strain ATCC BAA-861 / DSM 15982 / KCTC 12143 / HTCC2516) TaxID=314256 RepID=Q2CIS6_OCEGH|nr:chemotaxis protein CheD [Oceanicola granulosus]EAR52513.1 chemotaxis protein CheD [Oceanicola granulosus HTCC2516]